MMLLSDSQFHVVNEGGSTRLECAFHCSTYTLFDYPVIWRKQQLSEWTQVNVMGSLNKPFVSTDRFEVTFSNVSSRYLFELKIVGQSRYIIAYSSYILLMFCYYSFIFWSHYQLHHMVLPNWCPPFGWSVLFCSLAVFDPKVGHAMDVLSPFISVLCHFDWLFHRESCPRLDVVHPSRAWSSSLAVTWHCSLHYLFLQATPLFPHGVTNVC